MTDKPARRTREETKRLVLDAAVDLVRQEGLGAEPTTVTYRKVFAHLERSTGIRVTRASVHERIWPSQEDFQFEVLELLSGAKSGMPETHDSAVEVFEATAEMPPLERMRQMTRVAADVNLAIAQHDPIFYSWVGITMSLAKDATLTDDHAARLREVTAQTYDSFAKGGASLLRELAALIGLRPRLDLFVEPEDGFSLIARLGVALSEGCSLQTRFEEGEYQTVALLDRAGLHTEEWSMFAAGYWALLNSYMEVDPEVHPDGG